MSGRNAQGWLPPLGRLPCETWGSSDLQPRQAPALLGTGSLKASELKHWLPEQKSVVGEHMAGVSSPPHLGYLQGLLHALTGSGAT